MKNLLSLCLLALASAQTKTDFPSAASTNESQTIEIIRNRSHSATKGPAQNFTGSVKLINYSLQKIRPVCLVALLPLSPEHALRGTRIRSVRFALCLQGPGELRRG